MSNEIQAVSAQNEITQQLLMDYLKTITDSLDENQRMQFCAVAQAFNLNPFKREIYATTYRDSNTGKTNMSIVVGYEVYLKRAEMNPNFDGFETEFNTDKDRGISCTCTVYRKDRQHPTKSTVYMNEYSTGRSLWKSKPMVMLEKVAICTAFRRSFPTDFGGIPYAPEELSQTTEEKLQQQGYTEVKAEKVEPTAEEKKANFVNAMEDLKKKDEKTFNIYFKFLGYEKFGDVPAEERQNVFKAIRERIDEVAKQAAAEAAEGETENG